MPEDRSTPSAEPSVARRAASRVDCPLPQPMSSTLNTTGGHPIEADHFSSSARLVRYCESSVNGVLRGKLMFIVTLLPVMSPVSKYRIGTSAPGHQLRGLV